MTKTIDTQEVRYLKPMPNRSSTAEPFLSVSDKSGVRLSMPAMEMLGLQRGKEGYFALAQVDRKLFVVQRNARKSDTFKVTKASGAISSVPVRQIRALYNLPDKGVHRLYLELKPVFIDGCKAF